MRKVSNETACGVWVLGVTEKAVVDMFVISGEQITYKRIWNILFHVKVMPFNNSYRVAKLY